MGLVRRTTVQIGVLAAVIGGLVTLGSGSFRAEAATTLWRCNPPPTATSTPSPTSSASTTSASASASASASTSPSPTGTPTPAPLPIPQVQIVGPPTQVDETRSLFQIQLKSPGGYCWGGNVVLWESLNGQWVQYAVVKVPNSGTGPIWVSARSDTLWRAYAAPTATRQPAWSTFVSLKNVPPKPVITTPSNLPRAAAMAPQQRAVGHGANAIVTTIPDAVWNQMNGISWHSGCPVGRADLRLLTVNYWGFDGYRHRGELVVAAKVASRFVGAFNGLYGSAIPIRGLHRVDAFGYSSVTNGGNDPSSMQHDNTSAFNCRWVVGSPGVRSPHSYGTAIDLNPYENPYNSATGWTPNVAWAHIRITPYAWKQTQDQVVAIMRANGFAWTYGVNDSQHFDAH